MSRAQLAGKPADVSWVRRYGTLKGKAGLIALAAILAFGAAMWVKTRVLVVQPGKGIPVGSTVRGGTHVATLISQLQPYTPSLNHDGSTERFSLGVFLVPLDGSAPQFVRLVRDLPPGGYSLARVIGSDGRTMWIAINGLYGVDLRSYAPVAEADVIKANPGLDPDRLGDTRGMDIVDGRLQIVADDRSAAWRLEPATLKAEPVTPRHVYRPLSNPPITLTEPLPLTNPDGVLRLHPSGDDSGAGATLLVSRVDAQAGQPLWTVDTGIHRFKLEQILPGGESTVFVGTRPPVPDKLSEPLLVILDHATGQLTTHSLWQ